MIPSRVLLLSTIALWVVFLSIMQIPVIQSLVGDPPSLYNRGDGGLSELVSAMTVYRRVKVVRSADEVWQHSPRFSVLILAGLDTFLKEYEIPQVLKWVESGGVLVVLDEYTTPRPLLEKVDVKMGQFFSSISVGECYVGNSKYLVLFNVYREIVGGRPICWVDKLSVAVEVALGDGRVVVFGDSSIFINEVLRSGYRPTQLSLALALLDRDTVVFYEGGRVSVEMLFSPKVFVSIPYYIGKFAGYVLLGDFPTGVIKILAAGLLFLALVFHKPPAVLAKPLNRGRRRKSIQPRIDTIFKESVKAWLDWVSRLGK